MSQSGSFRPCWTSSSSATRKANLPARARAEGVALSEQIQAEGTVLVQNNDNVLPLSKDDAPRVNVFGWAVTDWVISGSGSGQVKRAGAIDLLEALEEYGIEYNTELTDMYEGYRPNREFSIAGSHAGSETGANPGSSGSLHSFNYEFSRLYEPDIEDRNYYSDSLLSNAESYSDTALVVIGRVSGESNDSPEGAVQGLLGQGQAEPAVHRRDAHLSRDLDRGRGPARIRRRDV